MADVTTLIGGWKSRPLYARVAIIGLLLFALMSLVFAAIPTGGETSTLVFFIIPIVLSGIVAGLMWRLGRWALVVASVWGFLNLWWAWLLVLSLRYPNSVFDFVLPLLLTVGAPLTA
ncbi:MAG: hypothetical protein IIC21_10335, partial [Chloroflexi bacterium]|nr:hypothetical protein [Chloroflexota bacterium]